MKGFCLRMETCDKSLPPRKGSSGFPQTHRQTLPHFNKLQSDSGPYQASLKGKEFRPG